MKKAKGRMDESILVCVYYGPNGERLIKRGAKIANMLDCPLYILTVDPLPYDELDAEKSAYIDRWKELAEEYDVEEFIIRDNEKKPAVKVIAEVAREHHITQIIIGQTAKSRWEEITKGSFMNVLLREIPFVDFHVVSCDRAIKGLEGHFEKGVRAYLVEDEEGYRLMFSHTKDAKYEGIFFKETGTDFNNGIFKFMRHNKMCQVHITDDRVTEPTKIYPQLKEEALRK
ncbi:universal stress protein [Shouchella clausii]|jgi:two-component system, OmpR family, sensor histidine kinase KdpD|uniref:Osmosensitive K+ channel histidine kinase n=3 Tax=Shouchella TaxID=2893057 RepID=Q5WJY0_SHOC1|nr:MULTISPECIES: universal stress protein [Shouchella]MCM3314165.1 universal stress protein [Psychrobacillus sp. MER TA 17]ALA52046.1 Osmosensitive K+ channel histidine kinase KdpD [Shouchella clausii]KKI84787.1 histidine kinase [Shouchella clausii]MBU3230505.1 universal stress protein [Shouchella clausii]MBU3262296.1 universal stress protein [Shouchella clausii]